jgi:hypothetical protein
MRSKSDVSLIPPCRILYSLVSGKGDVNVDSLDLTARRARLDFDNSTRHHLAFYHFNKMMSTMQFASYLLFLVLLPLVSALKFDMAAHHGHESASKERCIRNFVAKDQLVVVTANVDGFRGDGQQLNMHVRIHVLACAIAITIVANITMLDQGCSRKRVWPTKGCCGREQICFHISRRFCL